MVFQNEPTNITASARAAWPMSDAMASLLLSLARPNEMVVIPLSPYLGLSGKAAGKEPSQTVAFFTRRIIFKPSEKQIHTTAGNMIIYKFGHFPSKKKQEKNLISDGHFHGEGVAHWILWGKYQRMQLVILCEGL